MEVAGEETKMEKEGRKGGLVTYSRLRMALGRFLIPKLVTRKMAFLADDKRATATTGSMPSPTVCFLPVRKRTRGAAAIGMLARVGTMKGKNLVVYEREREEWDWGSG